MNCSAKTIFDKPCTAATPVHCDELQIASFGMVAGWSRNRDWAKSVNPDFGILMGGTHQPARIQVEISLPLTSLS